MFSFKNEKKFYLFKKDFCYGLCLWNFILECWDIYEFKEIVLFFEILLLGVNSIIYMCINYYYYNI